MSIMLSALEFAEQQRFLGHKIHEHDGIFWEEVYPFYCKPAFIYTPLDHKKVRPSRYHSLLGYDHQVISSVQGNRLRAFMVMDRNLLDQYSLQKLSSKKRNQVRRGLERCVVEQITDIGLYLDRMLEINLSQAVRQEKGAGAETPSSRYTEAEDEWRRQMQQEFSLKGREWWGAFADGVLIAYLRTYLVDGIRLIEQTKADTVFLKSYPMDALYFTVLSEASSDPLCDSVVNGPPMHPSLNHFKEEFLFKAVEYPYYFTNPWLQEATRELILKWNRWSTARNLK